MTTLDEVLTKIFHLYDLNGDGVIVLDELITMYKEIDTRKGLIGEGQPVVEWRPLFEQKCEGRAKLHFDETDANKDGKLTLDEFLSRYKQLGMAEEELIPQLQMHLVELQSIKTGQAGPSDSVPAEVAARDPFTITEEEMLSIVCNAFSGLAAKLGEPLSAEEIRKFRAALGARTVRAKLPVSLDELNTYMGMIEAMPKEAFQNQKTLILSMAPKATP